METIDAILSRRSVRIYTKQQVEPELVQRLLELGTHAATGANAQPWAFVVLQNRARLDAYGREIKTELLANLQGQAALERYEKMLRSEEYDPFNTASTVICIFGNTDSEWFVNDCSMAAANIMLAAHDLGLGTCWIGFAKQRFGREDFLREHKVPVGYSLVATLAVGYPKGKLPVSERKEPLILNWVN